MWSKIFTKSSFTYSTKDRHSKNNPSFHEKQRVNFDINLPVRVDNKANNVVYYTERLQYCVALAFINDGDLRYLVHYEGSNKDDLYKAVTECKAMGGNIKVNMFANQSALIGEIGSESLCRTRNTEVLNTIYSVLQQHEIREYELNNIYDSNLYLDMSGQEIEITGPGFVERYLTQCKEAVERIIN